MSNYYEILGLEKTASDSDIKSAYRKLSLKYHPDKNVNNTEYDKNKIIDIQTAYEILSDQEKKKQYDFSLNNPQMGGGFEQQHFGANDEFAGHFDNIFKMFYQNGPQMATHIFKNINKPVPIILNLNISLEQSYKGTMIPVEVTRWVLVNDNQVNETETIYIPVPKGVDSGEILLLRERGNIINEHNKGDIKIIFKLINNTPFVRNGLDLYHRKIITLKESLCGFKFELTHLNEKELKYNTLGDIDGGGDFKVIPFGFNLTIAKCGMMRDDNVGNLIIEFIVAFPDKITSEQREKLKEIL
jgi:DnaJ-class molecular chaperone